VEAASGGFLVGGSFSLADIFLYLLVKGFQKGNYDYVPVDYLSAWPALTEFATRLEAYEPFAPHKL